MKETVSQAKGSLSLAAAMQVQQILSELAVPSVLYSMDGECLSDSSATSEENRCAQWPECQHRALQKVRLSPDDKEAIQIDCPDDHFTVAVPVRRRSEVVAVLCCCLQALRFVKTERLERICSRLNIDSTFLAAYGLGDAMSGPQTAAAFEILLERLLEKTQSCQANRTEVEALSSSLAQSYEELTLLHRISDDMNVTQRPEVFFRRLCAELKEVLDAEKVVVLWHGTNGPGEEIRTVASAGKTDLNEADVQLLWTRTARQGTGPEGVLIDSNVDGPYMYRWPERINSLLSVPIRRDQELKGVLAALNKTSKLDFDSTDINLLVSVANESAVYLENFRLYQDLQDLLLGSLRALTRSIDAKDPYTCGHSERVALISRRLAEQLSLNRSEIDDIYLAGLLHDVGKIGVSEAVLCKPGRLLPGEFEQITRHPAIGANILRGIKQMELVRRAALTHHERFDGTGYPQGLSGTDIPLSGRIVMLADSFDAMISERTYRRALPLETALAEIRRFSGTQFDPHLAEMFLKADLKRLLKEIDAVKTHQPAHDNLCQPVMN